MPSPQTDAYRLVSGAGDGLDGLYIEALGTVAFARLRHPQWIVPEVVPALVDALRGLGFTALRLICDEPEKHRERRADAEEAALNAAVVGFGMAAPTERFVVREQGRAFSVSVHDGFSWGLFTDMRQIRAELTARWRDRRVLNLFAYTCGFGVYLAPHNTVINVDVSRRYLGIGADNYRLNGLAADAAQFVANDTFQYLARAQRQGQRFDAIVLDPPAFSRGKAGRSRRFSIRTDLPELVAGAAELLNPGGELFVSTNLEGLSPKAFQATVVRAANAAGPTMALHQTWPAQADFPCLGAYHLKAALLGPG